MLVYSDRLKLESGSSLWTEENKSAPVVILSYAVRYIVEKRILKWIKNVWKNIKFDFKRNISENITYTSSIVIYPNNSHPFTHFPHINKFYNNDLIIADTLDINLTKFYSHSNI